MKKAIVILTLFILIVSYSLISYSHPGKTDASGGHYNRRTGQYHYHISSTQRTVSPRESRFLTHAPGAPGTGFEQPKENKEQPKKRRQINESKSKKTYKQRIEILEQQVKKLNARVEQLEQQLNSISQFGTRDASKKVDNEISIDAPGIGETGYLRTEYMTLAIDKKTHDELLSIVLAQDKVGYNQLVLSDRAFIVPNKAKVLVIDRGLFIRKVRILDGSLTNKSGWIEYEAVIKNNN